MIPKPGKPATELTSHRPISLLPELRKQFEKLLLKRSKPILDEKQIIATHQFGLRNNPSTIDQVYRITTLMKRHQRWSSSTPLYSQMWPKHSIKFDTKGSYTKLSCFYLRHTADYLNLVFPIATSVLNYKTSTPDSNPECRREVYQARSCI